eukprot:gene3505-4004_t
MSFPGSGLEATWRNSIKDVCTLLNKKHGGKFMIWNLCERSYDYSMFNNQILDFPFPDHHAPSLNLLFEIVNSLDNWLKADAENIAVVHCKGGKGRTGTIICCYLFYSCYFPTMEQSMGHFADMRSKTKKGVTQASQQRYISYFKEIVSGNFMIDVFSLNLVSIEMAPLTKEQAYSLSLEIFEHEKEATLSFASSPATLQVTPINESLNQYKVNILVNKMFLKDVLIRVYKGNTGKKKSGTNMKKQIFHLIFNISFIDLTNNRLVFGKKDLDHFKKAQKNDDFYLECIFQNNCTALPDHSFQIWNIMAMKYQQMRVAMDEKVANKEIAAAAVVTAITDGETIEGLVVVDNDDTNEDTISEASSEDELEKQDIDEAQVEFGRNGLTFDIVNHINDRLNDVTQNIDVLVGRFIASSSSPSPINYRASRMVGVQEVKQMILSLDYDNEIQERVVSGTIRGPNPLIRQNIQSMPSFSNSWTPKLPTSTVSTNSTTAPKRFSFNTSLHRSIVNKGSSSSAGGSPSSEPSSTPPVVMIPVEQEPTESL